MLAEVTNSAPELPNHFTTLSMTSDLGYTDSNNTSNYSIKSRTKPKRWQLLADFLVCLQMPHNTAEEQS